MNAAEEHAVMSLAEASTPHAKRHALDGFRGKGVRLSAVARSRLARAASIHPVPVAMISTKFTHLLEPGPEPMLDPKKARAIQRWCQMWLNVEVFPPAVRPGAVLFHGPTGTGKTTTAAWCASLLSDRYAGLRLGAHDWVASHLGQSGNNLSEVFAAIDRSPQLLVMEEIDAIATRRGGDGAASAECDRITIAMMRLLDGARFPIVCTTNRVDSLDTALLRRFDALIELPEPSHEAKLAIVRGLGVDGCCDLSRPIVDLVRDAKESRRSDILAGIEANDE